jgi:tetratricopeptide (TPR) repeat protein
MPLVDFDALWDYEHPADTETVFRQLLSQAEHNEDRSYLLQLLTQIARTQGLQRHCAEAHATLDRVQLLLTADLVQANMRYLLERGRVFNSSGHPDDARSWFQQAWELAQAHTETFYAIDAAHMLAIVAPPADQLTWNTIALQLAEAATDERAHRWCGSLYNNLGWTYHNAGHYELALELFQKALHWQQVHGKAHEQRIAQWCVGRTLRSLRHHTEALALQMALFDEWERDGGGQDGYVAEEIAECLLVLGRTPKSYFYFALAYSLLVQDPWLVERESERLQRLKQLSQPQS